MLNGVNPETKASSRKANNSWQSTNIINTRKYSVIHSKHLSSPSGRLIASEQELQLANDWLYYITLYALNENLSPQSQVSTPIKPPPMSIATRKDIPRKSRTEIEDFHFKDAVNTYQQLEKEEIFCRNCQQQSKKVNSFGYHDGFICMNCAAKAYTRISELVDWEEIVENGRGIQCDRLRHQKKLSSFIKFENKTGTYKRVKLCIFCRNVKRWEYSRKSLCPVKNSHSPNITTATTTTTTTTTATNTTNSIMNNNNNIINPITTSTSNNNNNNINSNICSILVSPKRRKVDELIPILPRPPPGVSIVDSTIISNNNNNNNNIPITIMSNPNPQNNNNLQILQQPPPPLPLPLQQQQQPIKQQKQQQQQQQQYQQPIQPPVPISIPPPLPPSIQPTPLPPSLQPQNLLPPSTAILEQQQQQQQQQHISLPLPINQNVALNNVLQKQEKIMTDKSDSSDNKQ